MITIPSSDFAERLADFAIQVAVEVELEAVEGIMRPVDGRDDLIKVIFPDGSAYYLGMIGQYRCVVNWCQAGSGGRDGSILAGTAMIERWQPRALLLVGIAFGKNIDEKKQVLGDILISTQVVPYELARIGEKENHQRGPRPEAGITLVTRARNLRFKWTTHEGQVRSAVPGPILSGEKLVDNMDFKRKLFVTYPDAIGGEMEGAGTYAAAERAGIEWIIIKAICDWGDGAKNKEAQPLAAANATAFLRELLAEPGLDSLHRSTRKIGADAPPTTSPQDFMLENIRKEIRRANEKRQQAGNALLSFLSTCSSGISPELMPVHNALDAANQEATEEWLNGYADASAHLLNGTVSLVAFNNLFGEEILQICDTPGVVQDRVKQAGYKAIWAARERIAPLWQKGQ